jgi:dihydroorotase/allantoinase
MAVDTVIENGVLVTEDGLQAENAGLAISGGKIVSIGHDHVLPEGERTINVKGKIIAPGIVDCHVHTREPGQEHREDWEHATRSAAAGGVTSIIAMPNTDPVIDCPENLRKVYELIESKSIVDAQSYGLLTGDNLDQLKPLVDAGAVGFKCFLLSGGGGQYEWGSPDDGQLIEAMQKLASIGARVGFHEENDEIINHYSKKYRTEGKNHPKWHARAAGPIAEQEAISRICLFAESTGCPVHMFHESSGSGAEIVRRAKNRGVDVTAETMPHYLQFTVDDLDKKGSAGRVNPPLRTAEEQERLWKIGIKDGAIDCIATDHAPYTDEEKGMKNPHQSTWNTASGFVGLETQVPAMLTLIHNSKLTYEKWLTMHCQRPAEIWGMYPQKGSLRVGTDADVMVLDPTIEWKLDRKNLRSKSTVTPYHEETFEGQVSMTIVRDNIVYQENEVVGAPGTGKVIEVK